MSLHRRAARRDKNEPAIVELFVKSGCTVLYLSQIGAPDLLVGLMGRMALVENKAEGYAGQLTDHQIAWHRKWKGTPPVIVRNAEDAMRVVHWLRFGV